MNTPLQLWTVVRLANMRLRRHVGGRLLGHQQTASLPPFLAVASVSRGDRISQRTVMNSVGLPADMVADQSAARVESIQPFTEHWDNQAKDRKA